MKNYDVVIVGTSTAGSYFARRMAEKGFSVLAIEKDSKEKISPDYDIFHMGKDDMEKFDLPKVTEGDGICEFVFTDSDMMSAYGNYPKPSPSTVVGMHKREYIQLMNDWAVEAGAEILYNTAFNSLIYNESGKISGVTYIKDNGEKETVSCRLVADCSGIPAVVRRSLPQSYGVETFELTSDDILYVVLRYVDFVEKKGRWLQSQFWLSYKSWLAPSAGSDAILGIGALFGFDHVEKVFEKFTSKSKLPAYTVKRIEKGRTPYHRAPYSFVSDGFIAMGDAACLTKPNCGEGCTASLALEQIAVEVASKAMENGAYPTREALWSINKKYNDGQGKEFASLMALLLGLVKHSDKANEFFFKHDVIFSKKILGSMNEGIVLGVSDYLKILVFVVIGIVSGNVKVAEIKSILKGVIDSGKLTELYERFPETPDGFDAWVAEAEAMWKKVGKLSDWKQI